MVFYFFCLSLLLSLRLLCVDCLWVHDDTVSLAYSVGVFIFHLSLLRRTAHFMNLLPRVLFIYFYNFFSSFPCSEVIHTLLFNGLSGFVYVFFVFIMSWLWFLIYCILCAFYYYYFVLSIIMNFPTAFRVFLPDPT